MQNKQPPSTRRPTTHIKWTGIVVLALLLGSLAAQAKVPATRTPYPRASHPRSQHMRPHAASPLALAERRVAARAHAVVVALQHGDTASLARYVHPTRGVRFSPFGFALQDHAFTSSQVSGLRSDAHRYRWGHETATGKLIQMPWPQFERRYIYNGSFAGAREIHIHPLSNQPFTLPELNATYAGGILVEYHLPGHRALSWKDARSLWMIWQKSTGTWYLTAVANQTQGVNYIGQKAAQEDRWNTLAFILSLFTAVIFIPVGIEKIVSREPHVTRALIGLNVLIFLVTVVIANIHLPQDRAAGQHLLLLHPAYRGAQGEEVALAHARTPQGFAEVWQMEHADSDYVLEPHYSALNRFAYRPAEPSLAQKVIGLFGSMFLHGSLLHLAGNMIFLWVFGRALEEKFGHWWYLLVYLISGIAGTLAYHFTTTRFMPAAVGIPAFGASGAIAGLLGAFMLRFRRTQIEVFSIPPMSWPILLIAGAIWSAIGYFLFGTVGARVMFGLAIAACFWFGPGHLWHIYKMASMWAIGAWLLLFNIAPGVWSVFTGHPSGVAHWAHIGGFFAGLLFVAVVNPRAKDTSAADIRHALNDEDARRAALYAEKLLMRDPYNPRVHALRAEAYGRLDDEQKARDSYLTAISLYFATNDYGRAARAYLDAKRQHPDLVLPPEEQFSLGDQMVANQDWQNAAETYAEVYFAAPDNRKAEESLISSARLYLHRVQEPEIAADLLKMLLQQYPDTSWSSQAQYLLNVAQAAQETERV